ncbi:HNH endonuclease family protein [Burkholderia contaminans]|uniref:hypothetical protein n=1 Tax=Burkholderia contaminans TaxID=488447 RepID=UPI001CF5360B|nr:hypothetical protein [Burkholderia contaminans]MCA8102141.1 hypothetical protein [Burkholderia contaminans]
MIKVDRSKVAIPEYLDGAGSAGDEEMQANLRRHAAGNSDFVFEAYKHNTVKDRLEELFGRKCAYCESDIEAVQPSEIEHYRPKGRVAELNPTTNKVEYQLGYFWLAARWENLLVACIDCNRRRNHKDDQGDLELLGKADYFPLATGTARALEDATLAAEQPMLLNPCLDDPRAHLEFTDTGGVRAIERNGTADPRGAATIALLGLARGGLLKKRAKHAMSVRYCLEGFRESLKNGGSVTRHLNELLRLLDPKYEHTGLTKHLAATELLDLFRDVELPAALEAALTKVADALDNI